MMLKQMLREKEIPYAENEQMALHTTFRIGGPALLIMPGSKQQLADALALCRKAGKEPFLLGRGSNLLVSDAGIRRPVILLGEGISAIRREGNDLLCEAGASLIGICRAACEAGLCGMEWAYGIPGTLGGGIYMNAGAYGGEMKDIIVDVTYIDENGEQKTAAGEELELGYRHSMFEGRNCCITEARLHLTPCPAEEIRAKMEDYMRRRREKQPLEYGSAGSTFKRPVGNYASALVDQCGLKGLRVGDAQVSEKHAGFIINRGKATASEVLALIAEVQRQVKEKTGYMLECEVKIVE